MIERKKKMAEVTEEARTLLREFKGDSYIFGIDCLERIGELVTPFGKKTLLITNLGTRSKKEFSDLVQSLERAGCKITGPIPSARPNAPREDVWRLAKEIEQTHPDCVVVVAGGSGIDAAKAAVVQAVLGGDLEEYFGVGKVTERIQTGGEVLISVVAVQTSSGSGAHLTKYSNITDIGKGQKKIIVDEAITPPKALFDYTLTRTMSADLTLDGAFDGMAHCLEVFYGASPSNFAKLQRIVETGLELIIGSLEKAVSDGGDIAAREALGLGTDLGGYAIMLGSTSGPHLTSFSLVDILSHGRACAIMTPYFIVFLAPAIQRQLEILSRVYAKYGLVESGVMKLEGRDLGEAVARGMLNLTQRLGFPTTLREIKGFSQDHILRALEAAKNPQLEMKLKSMPVPLEARTVDDYFGPVLEAAKTGDFKLIKNV